jgi:hypothetical protein
LPDGLIAKQPDGETQGIEDGSSIVCGAQIVKGTGRFTVLHMMLPGTARSKTDDCLCGRLDVRGELLDESRMTVECNDSNPVRHVANHVFEHGGQRGELVIIEFASTCAAYFQYDHQRERLAARVLVQRELLRNAVIGEREVSGSEVKDQLP